MGRWGSKVFLGEGSAVVSLRVFRLFSRRGNWDLGTVLVVASWGRIECLSFINSLFVF